MPKRADILYKYTRIYTMLVTMNTHAHTHIHLMRKFMRFAKDYGAENFINFI